MNTQNITSDSRSVETRPATTRLPATVIVAAVLTVLVAAVGTYGAVYFSGLDGYDPIDATFISVYGYFSVVGAGAAIAQVRGSRIGRAGVIMWAIWMLVFTMVKIVTILETEAIPFGVVALVVLALTLASPTRRFIDAHNTPARH
ncbi:hypothetical protein [Diaminobutyricimonas sp. LJ205]|uniref:hypothetical protein n=1 Tax=Diaminobutyricimonas sp. LJ205 TaxID=2683590 RepID=UPI0012F511B6|nr:hypothetical protein [Diaminobutyricimonas sp. LJ205]